MWCTHCDHLPLGYNAMLQILLSDLVVLWRVCAIWLWERWVVVTAIVFHLAACGMSIFMMAEFGDVLIVRCQCLLSLC